MKEYSAIFIGTGSAMNMLGPILEMEPDAKFAVIDKDDPGGICLTRGCIPSKLLLYPADVLRTICSAEKFGIEAPVKKVDFQKIMERMHNIISKDIETIRESLKHVPNLDYYPYPAEFVAPYTLKVNPPPADAGGLTRISPTAKSENNETIKAPRIFLCTGSKPLIPHVHGLEKVPYLTSDTILNLRKLPASIGIIGGGYVAAEYGHFFAAMGSKVTIIGRDPQFLPREEPEISALATVELGKYLTLMTNQDVVEVGSGFMGKKHIVAVDRATKKRNTINVDEILLAVGRISNSDILKPEVAGIKVDGKGWIQVNEYLETSVPNIWAFGDAIGKYMFKHVANYESNVVFRNAILKKPTKAQYPGVPHAVFTYPEIASVGLREKEAMEKYGKANVLLGVTKYEDTAKGTAMAAEGYFVKIIAENGTEKILGAHIIGPQASILIQEIVNQMHVPGGSAKALKNSMYIHPALTEVVERAVAALVPVELYYHMLEHEKGHHDHSEEGDDHSHDGAHEHSGGDGHDHSHDDGHKH